MMTKWLPVSMPTSMEIEWQSAAINTDFDGDQMAVIGLTFNADFAGDRMAVLTLTRISMEIKCQLRIAFNAYFDSEQIAGNKKMLTDRPAFFTTLRSSV